MTVALRRPEPITVEDFLALLDRCPEGERWQLVEGEVVRLKAGVSVDHAAISANLTAALLPPARKRGCQVLPGMLVRNHDVDDTAVAPDVLVTCGAGPGTARFVDDPVVVVEVLSPSTMVIDRGAKLAFYETLPSLAHIVLVYQDEMRVETWSRAPAAEDEDDGDEDAALPRWRYEVTARPDDRLVLAALDFAMPLAEVYDGVDFGGAAA